MRQFWQHGYRGTSLEDLEACTGLKRGSIYAAFGDKKGFFLEVIRFYREEVVLRRRAIVDAAPNARVGIERFFKEILKPTSAPDLFWGCLNTNTVTELSGDDPDIQALVSKGISAWEDYWVGVVHRGQRDGSLPKTLRPKAVAKSLVVATQGANVVIKGLGKAAFPREAIQTILDGILS